MSADKPLETNTSVPSSGAGYRTLIPAGAPTPKPAAPAPSKTAEVSAKPEPAKPENPAPSAAKESPQPDPTRFGDWEVKGRCIDF